MMRGAVWLVKILLLYEMILLYGGMEGGNVWKFMLIECQYQKVMMVILLLSVLFGDEILLELPNDTRQEEREQRQE